MANIRKMAAAGKLAVAGVAWCMNSTPGTLPAGVRFNGPKGFLEENDTGRTTSWLRGIRSLTVERQVAALFARSATCMLRTARCKITGSEVHVIAEFLNLYGAAGGDRALAGFVD